MSAVASLDPSPIAVDDRCIVATLVSIAKITRVMLGIKVAELNLFAGQDDMILGLDAEIPIRISTLAENLNVRPSTVSKMMDRMHEKALAERVTHTTDARLTLVRLTPTGAEMKDRLKRIRADLATELERYAAAEGITMSVADLQGFDRLLAKRLQRLR